MSGDAFDLDAADPRPLAEEGIEMELLDAEGTPTGVIFLVRGFDARIYKETVERQVRRRAEILPRRLTPEESKAEFYEEHATLVAGWKGKPLTRGGQPFEYSPANAAKLLEQYDYIVEQIRRFAANRRNFLRGSARS